MNSPSFLPYRDTGRRRAGKCESRRREEEEDEVVTEVHRQCELALLSQYFRRADEAKTDRAAPEVTGGNKAGAPQWLKSDCQLARS